jgi:carboxyl-terminal processing protease
MPTIGEGSSNEFLELSDGSAFYVPVSNWFTPSGKSIHGIGIEPDIPVQLNQDDLLSGRDTQLIEAYQYLDKLLPAFQ